MMRRIGAEQVFPIGLGCVSMTSFYGTPDTAEAVAALHRAAELGVQVLDTADSYGYRDTSDSDGSGRNEMLVGNAIRGKRDKFFLCTKFGNLHYPDGRTAVNGRPEYVPVACDASLRRLGTDVIDLYFLHRVDPDVPIEETVGAMARLVERGKVRYVGLSEAGASTLRRGCAVHRIDALQTEYSLWTRDIEKEVLPVCDKLGVTLLAYGPLGRGFLTGSVVDERSLAPDDIRRKMPRFQGENLRRNLTLLDALTELSQGEGCTPAQLAIAWLLRRAPNVIPIPGASKVRHLEENTAAANVALSDSTIRALDAAFQPGSVHGVRSLPSAMRGLGL